MVIRVMHSYNQLSVLLPIKDTIKGKKAQIKNRKCNALSSSLSAFMPWVRPLFLSTNCSHSMQFPPILPDDPEAVLGGLLWRPWGSPAILSTPRRPTRCSNFGADSLESIWGRCLLCRRQQPVAEPQQSSRNPPQEVHKGQCHGDPAKSCKSAPPAPPPARSLERAELILNPFLWRTGSCSD